MMCNGRVSRWIAAWWLVTISALAGCGGPASLSGVVLLDDAPLDGAIVVLTPETAGSRMIVGTTAADGRFRVTTSTAASIKPGAYWITVSKRGPAPEPTIPATRPPEPDFPGAGAGASHMALPPELIPPRYSELAQTSLSVTMPHRGELELRLTSQ